MNAPVVRSLPPVTGSPGVCQGAYGERGNLELVALDPDDGFWVFWFNGDAVEHHSGAARGCWSAGLHVPTGDALISARISQVPFGPDFLEVLTGNAAGTICRWYWTPADGFVAGGVVTGSATGPPSPVLAVDGALVSVVPSVTGWRVLRAPVERYPAVNWRRTEVPCSTPVDTTSLGVVDDRLQLAVVTAGALSIAPLDEPGAAVGVAGRWRSVLLLGTVDGALALAGQDDGGRAVVALVDPVTGAVRARAAPDRPVHDVAATLSSLPGQPDDTAPARTVELITRRGDRLAHHRYDAATLRPVVTPADPVTATVWVESP